YDPSAPGAIRWDKTPEFTGFRDRVMRFVECDGQLYFAAKPALYERVVNGQKPSWKKVWSYSDLDPNSSGLRGLTAIPDQKGHSRHVLLAALEGDRNHHARIITVDPSQGFRVREELDIVKFLSARWGTLRNQWVIAAYNDIPSVVDPETRNFSYL